MNHYFKQEIELGCLLAQSKTLMDRILIREMAHVKSMPPEQGALLHTIYDGRDYLIEDLMVMTLKERSTIIRLVGRLKDKGLVSTSVVPGTRKHLVRITEAGKHAFDPVLMTDCFVSIFCALTPEEQTSLQEILDKLIKSEIKSLQASRKHPHDSVFDA
ncbi:MAG: MarR family winged helix-turn-helix transcriptional regulator [Dehalogenimonas sp.]|uniref:MarR family winged helix-turn-helix transcriptional regulator n=1 Tax=Candidatus Dehalogenimonas loeffleri TaxID=3127115 RepID=A0ABZ2J166_9CHLR|nr:MarR family winged helix-turn-helix transcriptional regulator [Dehalogenimonas sp.]